MKNVNTTISHIEQVESAYGDRPDPAEFANWGHLEVRSAFESKLARIRADIANDISLSVAISHAKVLGRCSSAAEAIGFEPLVYETESLLAQIFAKMITFKRDDARIRASEEFFRVGKKWASLKLIDQLAINLTNGALCLLEMNNPSKSQLLTAKKVCEKTVRLRKKGTVDFAYSQFNLSLAKFKCIFETVEHERSKEFSEILRGFDRAMRVFQQFPDRAEAYRSVYHANVMEVLEGWIRHEIKLVRRELAVSRLPKDIKVEDRYGMSAENYMSIVASNPAVAGYETRPDWVPNDDEIAERAAGRIPGALKRMRLAEKCLMESGSQTTQLALKLFEVQRLLTPIETVLPVPYREMDIIWRQRDIERYFVNAFGILHYVAATGGAGVDGYRLLLERIIECLVIFRTHWTEEAVSDLLSRHPVTFRMAACELGRLGQWEAAFKLLEYSRGLNSSRTWLEDPTQFDHVIDDITWVHVTHSPNASYLVFLRDGEYYGFEFPDLSGKILTSMFWGLGGDSLWGELWGSSVDRRAVREMALAFKGLGDCIDRNSGSKVVVMSGGFYQAFPIWACGDLGDATIRFAKTVTVAPSRASALRNSAAADGQKFDNLISVFEASNVSGFAPLEFAEAEIRAIESLLPEGWSSTRSEATKELMIDALERSGILHYAGHSVADLDPMSSSIVTYGEPVDVRAILDVSVKSSLVTFGSCESGLSLNLLHQDEMLSLQSAAFYSGAFAVIGTCWAVKDIVAAGYAFAFYRRCFESSDLGRRGSFVNAVIDAHQHAVSWLASATVYEVGALAREWGVEVSRASRKDDDRAFEFYDYAAFSLLGVNPGSASV